MSKCVGCYENEAMLQRLCAKCLGDFMVHVARPDELVQTHHLLHLAYTAVKKGELPLSIVDRNNLLVILNTLCWVMGCSGGTAMRDFVIVMCDKMKALRKQVKEVSTLVQ